VPSRLFTRARALLADPVGLARDLRDAARLLREVDADRWNEGPAALVSRMRDRGAKALPRSPESRKRHESVVYRLDQVIAGGPNCYRRALVRLALDPEAAEEPFILGLNVPPAGSTPSGHAWVEGSEQPDPHDVEFRL